MYRLIGFGQTSLDYYNQVDDIGSGATPTAYQVLPSGGAMDGFGGETQQAGIVERRKALRIFSDTAAGIEAIFFGLMRLKGKRDKLYRRTATGEIQWIYARCVEVSARRSYEQAKFKYIQDMELTFACQEAHWRGANHETLTFDSGLYFDSGLTFDASLVFDLEDSPAEMVIALEEMGRAPVRSMQITVTAGDAPVSAVSISRAGGETLAYEGSIAAEGKLMIDTGTMQVTCSEVTNAYNHLQINADADLAGWFTLMPGENLITVTFEGGGDGTQISFGFYEAWL